VALGAGLLTPSARETALGAGLLTPPAHETERIDWAGNAHGVLTFWSQPVVQLFGGALLRVISLQHNTPPPVCVFSLSSNNVLRGITPRYATR